MTVSNGFINTDLRVINYNGSGPLTVQYDNNGLTDTKTIQDSSTDTPLSILRLDPIVASLRISVIASPDTSTIPNYVSLEILSGIYYLEERTEVSLSVILSDGYRMLITDPSQIAITSSNETVAIVNGNGVVGKSVGQTMLTVDWIVCNAVFASETIVVEVSFDQHRPEFIPSQDNTVTPEDANIGYIVYTVQAIDQDSQDVHTDDILYNLILNDTHDGIFSIDQQTGEITVTGALDRETVDRYVLEIEATDQVQRDQLDCQNNLLQTTPSTEAGSGNSVNETVTCPGVSPISVFTVSDFIN